MPYPEDDALPDTAGPSPFTAQSVYPAQPGATNPELAREYLATHRGDMAARAPEIDNSLSKMQLNVDSMTKMLDDTVASIKAAKSGRSNVPLMAMAAGLLSGTGNFGSQLGAGFGAMVPAIQKQRAEDEHTELNLAQLGMRKAMLQQAPLEAKLAYMKAMQTGDQSAVRAIEQSLIRAQATGAGSGNRADKLSLDRQKAAIAALEKAAEGARKSVNDQAGPMDWDADQIREEQRQEFLRRAKFAKAAGADIPDDLISSAEQQFAPRTGADANRKVQFVVPTREQTLAEGLPSTPYPYVYEAVGRKEGEKRRAEQEAAFIKEKKAWSKTSEENATMAANLDQFEGIMKKKPEIFGRVGVAGMGEVLPNNMYGLRPNTSSEAQAADAITAYMELHGIPQGQGAWSEMERGIMAKTVPSMKMNPKANQLIIDMTREGIKRDRDRREFFDKYFNSYRTMDGMQEAWDRYIASPAGTVIARDGAGNPVPNKNRMNWREYFKKERGEQGPDAPLAKAKGGAIALGSEYD